MSQATGQTAAERTRRLAYSDHVYWVNAEPGSGQFGYAAFNSKLFEYNVKVARIDNGRYVITSNNIRLYVKALSFAGVLPAGAVNLNRRLDVLRGKKNNDDSIAYGKSTWQLGFQEAANYNRSSTSFDDSGFWGGYFGCEQHIVWAYGASARTGWVVPPEFFIENEGFGGTAGNGPEILPGGYVGEALSTISMAHDSDWMIGRLFGKSPLGVLYGLYMETVVQYKRGGSCGLFPSSDGLLPKRDGLDFYPTMRDFRHPGRTDEWYQQEDERKRAVIRRNQQIHDAIDAALDATSASGVRYTNENSFNSCLHPWRDGWMVQYKDKGSGGWLNDGGYDDFGAMITAGQRDQYRWNGSESATAQVSINRNFNEEQTPYFSSLKKT